jgi:hypothetical protein
MKEAFSLFYFDVSRRDMSDVEEEESIVEREQLRL